jgi:mediator of RNA polymerase II transcription subunit 17, fungi type
LNLCVNDLHSQLCSEYTLKVDSDMIDSQETSQSSGTCDLIYSILHVLLLRMHGQLRSQRLGNTEISRNPSLLNAPSCPLLQPIIDILQYKSFCERVELELNKIIKALSVAGISSDLRFTPVGESGKALVKLLDEGSTVRIGGEAVLKISNTYAVHHPCILEKTFTFI